MNELFKTAQVEESHNISDVCEKGSLRHSSTWASCRVSEICNFSLEKNIVLYEHFACYLKTRHLSTYSRHFLVSLFKFQLNLKIHYAYRETSNYICYTNDKIALGKRWLNFFLNKDIIHILFFHEGYFTDLTDE